MKANILATAAFGLGIMTLPALAAGPAPAAQAAPAAAFDGATVQLARGNANHPSRRRGSKQYGQTTGGPRGRR